MNTVIKLFETAARADRAALIVTRIGLVVVLVWIGSLKVFHYEAEGIVPFVANSPFMRYPPTESGTSVTERTPSRTASEP